MITLRSKAQNPPQAACEYQVDKDGRYGWFLCTWHPESHLILEEIQAEIKLELMNSDIRQVSKLEAEKWLKSFFADFHWKLHARLRRTELKEKGISLFLGLMYDNEIIFTQFGRMFCTLGGPKKTEAIGKDWEHSHLQTLEQLNLLGLSEEEIRVKTQKVLVPERHFLLVLPGAMARELFGGHFDGGSVNALLDSLAGKPGALWLLLGNEPEHIKTKRKGVSRLHLATILLIFFTLLAIVYVIFGGRFFEMTWRKARMLFQSKKPIPLEQIPNYLNIDNQKVRNYLQQALKSPAREVELKLIWNTDLPYQVTAAPGFDLDNIYLASNDMLLAFNKKGRNLLWNKSLGGKVQGITGITGGLMINLEDQRVLGLNNNGELSWEQPLGSQVNIFHSLKPMELTNIHDPRIDGSLIVVPTQRSILVLDGNSGEKLSEITFKDELQYLSTYDSFQNCFYAVVQDTMICLELKILS